MTGLDRDTYRGLYDSLESYEDIRRIHDEHGFDEDLLLVIYTHRVSRDASKRYYPVLHQAPRLLSDWKRGKSYLQIAQELRFPPVLIAQMIEKQKATPRKTFWDGFRHPEAIADARMRREVLEVLEADWVYSPRGGELQRARGVKGEERLAAWLKRHNLTYRTEKDLRGKFAKTPDALLDHPIWVGGQKIHWIESKANFGDDVELRRNLRKQLEPYVGMFGPGAVVYWYGFVSGAQSPDGILLWDGDMIEGFAPEPPPEGGEAPAKVSPPTRPAHHAPASAPPAERRERPARSEEPPAPVKPKRRPVDRSAYF